MLAVLLLGAVLRLSIGAWNSFIQPIPGADSDALAFHQLAVAIAQGNAKFEFVIGWVYAHFLGLVYVVTGQHIFVACALSTGAWVLSAYVLVLITKRLQLPPRSSLFIAAVYAFLPSSLLYTSVPLREAYQLLFVNLMALGLLDIFDKERVPANGLFIFVGSAILAGFLHGVLILVGAVAALGALTAIALSSRNQSAARHGLLSIAVLLTFVLYSGFLFINYSYGSLLSNGSAALGHRFINALPRAATYLNQEQGIFRDQGITVAVFQYLFEPMPWRELRPHDYFAMTENALRGAMLLLSVYGLVRLRGELWGKLVALLVVYACLESIWAFGTSNWGTALRHHVPSWGLLLVAGSCFLLQRKSGLANAEPTGQQVSVGQSGLPSPVIRHILRRRRTRQHPTLRAGEK